MDQAKIERYKQRYETWRHLDGLRYYTVEISVVAGVGAVALIEAFGAQTPIWTYFFLAVFFAIQGGILHKINSGIVSNGEALHRFGNAVGDEKIPDVSNKRKSVFNLIVWLFWIGSGFFFLVGIINYFKD